MNELMKLKYRQLIKEEDCAEILILLDKVLTNLQQTLISSPIYNEEELIKNILPLKEENNEIYKRLFIDIKNKTLVEREK